MYSHEAKYSEFDDDFFAVVMEIARTAAVVRPYSEDAEDDFRSSISEDLTVADAENEDPKFSGEEVYHVDGTKIEMSATDLAYMLTKEEMEWVLSMESRVSKKPSL
jgi:hypothetical protein